MRHSARVSLQVLQWPSHKTFGSLSHLFIIYCIYIFMYSWTLQLSDLCVEEHNTHPHICTVFLVLSEINISFAPLHWLNADWHPFLRGQLRDMHTHADTCPDNPNTHTVGAQSHRLLWLTHLPCCTDTTLTLYPFQMRITLCSLSSLRISLFPLLFTHLIKVKLRVFPCHCVCKCVYAYSVNAVSLFSVFWNGCCCVQTISREHYCYCNPVNRQWLNANSQHCSDEQRE